MGSQSVTCYPTQVNVISATRLALIFFFAVLLPIVVNKDYQYSYSCNRENVRHRACWLKLKNQLTA